MQGLQFLKTPVWLVLVVSLFTFSSCLTYQDVEIVSVNDVKVEKFTKDEARVAVTVTVDNPNSYKIKIVNSDLDLFLNGNAMGEAVIDNTIVLPKKSRKEHTIYISTDLSKAAGLLPTLFTMALGSQAKFRVTGTIKAKAFGIGKKFPVDFQENVKLPSSW